MQSQRALGLGLSSGVPQGCQLAQLPDTTESLEALDLGEQLTLVQAESDESVQGTQRIEAPQHATQVAGGAKARGQRKAIDDLDISLLETTDPAGHPGVGARGCPWR